jgi:hypothetical protein
LVLRRPRLPRDKPKVDTVDLGVEIAVTGYWRFGVVGGKSRGPNVEELVYFRLRKFLFIEELRKFESCARVERRPILDGSWWRRNRWHVR